VLFNFALGYAIRKVQDNQKGLKLNGIEQLSVYTDEVIIVGENTNNIKKSMKALLDASK
jgi:hypothetical protein